MPKKIIRKKEEKKNEKSKVQCQLARYQSKWVVWHG